MPFRVPGKQIFPAPGLEWVLPIVLVSAHFIAKFTHCLI